MTPAKRLMDVALSLLLLAVLWPVILLVALVLLWREGRPVLYVAERMRAPGRPFPLYKFRTMHHAMADTLADQQTVRNDPRVTRVGATLRKLSIDELPQLINVLRGDMSLVGPRPHAPNTKAAGQLFADVVQNYALRHRVKPGITGWAQVNGWRGETKTVEDIRQRVEHDLHYIENWSFSLDAKILMLTLLREIRSRTAF